MLYIIIFVGAVIFALLFGFGMDFIEQFIPERIFDTALIIGGFFWLRWALKDVIKEAVSEAIRENKDFWLRRALKDVIKEAVSEAIRENKD